MQPERWQETLVLNFLKKEVQQIKMVLYKSIVCDFSIFIRDKFNA